MRELKQSIVRSIRLSVELDKSIQDIARLENRTPSNIIQKFLNDSVRQYLTDRPEFYSELNDLDLFEKKKSKQRLEFELAGYND